MIPRDALSNKLRELGYRFKKETERVCLYKRPGNPSYATVPRRALVDEAYVRGQLGLAGCDAEEIERFIAGCKQGH